MSDLATWAGVCLGAGMGAVARAAADRGVAARVPWQRLPWATLGVNIIGSFLLGLVLTLPEARGAGPAAATWVAILGVGFCGGLTTFSTFSWEAFTLMREGKPRTAASYAVITIALTLVAVSLGTGLGHRFW